MKQSKCYAYPKISNSAIQLRRYSDTPKYKINFGLRRKSSLIEQNFHRRNSPTSYTLRKDPQTTWLSNDTEVIGIENKYINEIGIDLNNFFKIEPQETNTNQSETDSELSLETVVPMERVNVADVCKLLEVQSGLTTVKNVMDCLSEYKPSMTCSKTTANQINPRRMDQAINEKLIGNGNVKAIDYRQLKNLKESRGASTTSSTGRSIKRRSSDVDIRKKNSPRKVFLSKKQLFKTRENQIEVKEKFIEEDLLKTMKPQPLAMEKILKKNTCQISEDETNRKDFSWKVSFSAEEEAEEKPSKEEDQEEVMQDEDLNTFEEIEKSKIKSNQPSDNFIISEDTIHKREMKTEKPPGNGINRFNPVLDPIKETPEVTREPKQMPIKDQKTSMENLRELKNDHKSKQLVKAKKSSRPLAAVEPKYLAKFYQQPLEARCDFFRKSQLPLANRAKVLKEPQVAYKFDVNLEDLVFPEPKHLSSLILYNMDSNIDRESAMRTSMLVERAQHLRQEYEKRLLIEKFLDSMPEHLNETQAEFAKTMCAFPKNRLKDIDRCPCGGRLTQCKAIMSRHKWYAETDSLTKWLLSTPPAIIISIFIICLFSICVLNSESPKPMTTWEYMMSPFQKQIRQPTKSFRSNFF